MRHRRVWRLVLTGAFAALVLGVVAVAVFTRTQGGRTRVLDFTLEKVGGRLNGDLDVGSLAGNLITGAKLYDLSLRDADSALIIQADSAYIDYELPTFFGGDVVLTRLVIYSGQLFISKAPGDSLWNYQEVLLDTTRTPGEPGAGRATIVSSARFVDSEVTVHAPWEPAATLSEREREIEIAEALADTSRLEVTPVEGGYLRRMFFDIADASISDLVISADERGGTFVRVDSATAQAELYRGEPLDIVDLSGELSMRQGLLSYDAPRIVLPGSELTSVGTIDLSGPEPRYDLRVDAPGGVALEDLLWLYPHMPAGGKASFAMWLETRGAETLYRFRDVAFTAPGTRLVGSFGLLVGESLQFTDVNLTAAPLRVETIEEMLPAGLPVTGLTIGEVEIRSSGPATRATG